jgi:hypothetical protein
MKREVPTKSVGTKVSEAELWVLESRAERAGLTLVGVGARCAAGVECGDGDVGSGAGDPGRGLGDADDPLNFMLKVGEGTPIPEAAGKKLIEWADQNKMRRALEVLTKTATREERTQTAPPTPLVQHQGPWWFLCAEKGINLSALAWATGMKIATCSRN